MPSMSAIDEIEINASPETVFGVVSDYGNAHIWLQNYQCKIIGDNPIAEGSKISHQVGKMVKFIRRIDKITAGERLEESYIEGDLKGTGVWNFTPTDNGTLASFTCKVSSKSWLTHIGFIVAGAKGHKDAYKKILADLKEHCEAL